MAKSELPECLPRPLPVLTREKAAEYCRELGFPMTKQTLARLAVAGGGPAYRYWGRRVLYRPEDIIAWAEQRSGAAHSSSTEHDAA